VRLPTFDDIVNANAAHINRSGGRFKEPDNLLNPDRLKWVVDAILYPLGDQHLYPTIVEKSAILAYTIVCGHVFYDGNKRTGLSVLQATLAMNCLRFAGTEEDVVAMGLRLADTSQQRLPLDDLVQWVRDHLSL